MLNVIGYATGVWRVSSRGRRGAFCVSYLFKMEKKVGECTWPILAAKNVTSCKVCRSSLIYLDARAEVKNR